MFLEMPGREKIEKTERKRELEIDRGLSTDKRGHGDKGSRKKCIQRKDVHKREICCIKERKREREGCQKEKNWQSQVLNKSKNELYDLDLLVLRSKSYPICRADILSC